MATPNIDQKLQIKDWEKDIAKRLVTQSVWGRFGALVETSMHNGQEVEIVPDAVMLRKKGNLGKGAYSVTIPLAGRLTGAPKYGKQTVSGSEGSIDLLRKEIRYNVQRKGASIMDGSVDGDILSFWQLGDMAKPILEEYFTLLEDFDCYRALMLGASENLTESTAWTGSSISNYPSIALHPNIYVWNANNNAKITYSSTHATYRTSVDDALDSVSSTTSQFDLDAVEFLCDKAHETLIPLNGAMKDKLGGNKFVAIVTHKQYSQLVNGINDFTDRFAAGATELSKNAGITGKVFTYREVLFMVGYRNPVWNLAASGDSKFVFVAPSNVSQFGIDIATRAVHAVIDDQTGTGEIAFVCGKGALGYADAKPMKFVFDTTDFEFFQKVAGQRSVGHERMDFASDDLTTPYNVSSFLFITPTAQA